MNRVGWPVTSFSPFIFSLSSFLPSFHPFLFFLQVEATIFSLIVREEDRSHLVTNLSVSTWHKTPQIHMNTWRPTAWEMRNVIYICWDSGKSSLYSSSHSQFCLHSLAKYLIFKFIKKEGVSSLEKNQVSLLDLLALKKRVYTPYFPFEL